MNQNILDQVGLNSFSCCFGSAAAKHRYASRERFAAEVIVASEVKQTLEEAQSNKQTLFALLNVVSKPTDKLTHQPNNIPIPRCFVIEE